MPEISNVVVLMLENRSFDAMLGRLYPGRADFKGLSGREFNTWGGKSYPVWGSSGALTPDDACIPAPDPSETFADMTAQIYDAGNQPPSPPTMGGFVANYATTQTHRPGDVMHGFSPEQLPVLSELARAFAVCDDWHASAPNQTWPNRLFLHTGTAGGDVNNTPQHAPYLMDTIFNLLERQGRTWRIYHHDLPQALALGRIWEFLPTHLSTFDEFLDHAARGTLANYSFIEPRYFADPLTRSMPNDQHPPHDVRYGERLIARCYDALRSGPGWKNTLFLILYDEHGGIYDHVPPPAAVSPDDLHQDGFAFDRYGVRIPAVIVSPWVPAGSIVHRPAGSPYPYDHTAVIATLREIYGLSGNLTQRDAAAPHFLHALSLDRPTNDGPASIPLPMVNPSDIELQAAHASRPNAHQQALAQLASALPSGVTDMAGYLAGGAASTAGTTSAAFDTAADAIEQGRKGLMQFLSA
ncbi:MAG: hypothetical protein M0037_04760 [Betaproteobacteria bacterium]|nr:hypothetical protein [Betaproteobacteria bacterium]